MFLGSYLSCVTIAVALPSLCVSVFLPVPPPIDTRRRCSYQDEA